MTKRLTADNANSILEELKSFMDIAEMLSAKHPESD